MVLMVDAFFEDALNILSQQGTSLWTDMPYDENDYLKKPSDMVKEKAKPYRILQWRRINVQDSREVKMHVNRKFPVIFGAKIDENFKAGKKGGSTNEFIWNTNTQGGLELG